MTKQKMRPDSTTFSNEDVVWELLGNGAQPSPVADKRWTPLLAAALGGHSEVVRQLVGAGASVEEASSKGWNSLHMASQAGHIGAMAYIVAFVVVGVGCGVVCVARESLVS